MRAELYLAYRYLFRGKLKHISFISVVSCLGVALGVGTLIVVISVMNGFDRDLTERLLKFNYHLTIEAFSQDDLDKVGEVIKKWPEVKSASLFLQTQVFGKFDNLVYPLAVRGIDFNSPQERKLFYQYVKKETAKKGFFVGQGLKRRFGLDKTIEFYPLKKRVSLKEAKIRGSFSVGLYDIDNSYLIADLETAKSLSPHYLIFLGVRLDNPFNAAKIKERIEKEFTRKLAVSTWAETNRILFSALRLEKITMFIILSLIILVACFNIFATLTVKVVEKTKDIGVLKALGFTSRKILAIFSLQGLLLGFIGVFLGLIFGIGLCVILKKYPFIRLPQEIYYIEYLPVAMVLRDIILIILVSLALSFIFSLAPAWRASRLSASQALRYE